MAEQNKDKSKPFLTGSDVERLLREPSPTNRGDIVAKIANEFSADTLSDRERQIATQIFRLLLSDVEVIVRRAMAEALRATPTVPHDIAMALARDLNEVAVPVLESSAVLSDEDLIEIVRNPVGAKLVSVDDDPDMMMVSHDPPDGTPKQIAVAKRPVVSARVSAALVENGNEDVAATLMRNEGADITDPVAHRVVDRYGTSEPVQEALIDRSQLPVAVMERLAYVVSDELRKRLTKRRGLPPELAAQLTTLVQEKATLELLRNDPPEDEIERLVRQLWESKRLSPTLILRAACIGETAFFEIALARRANQAVDTIRDLLSTRGEARFMQLFHLASIPANIHKALRAAIEVAESMQDDGVPVDREEYIRAMISGILERCNSGVPEAVWPNLGAHDLEFALARMAADG